MDWAWYLIIIALVILLVPVWLYIITRMLTWAAFSSWEEFFSRAAKRSRSPKNNHPNKEQ